MIQAGLHANAVALIGSGDAPEDVELLESALRASLVEARGSAMSPEMAAAVRRAAQLLLASGEAERAFRLAVDSGQWTTAAPIARDYLEPRPEMLEICEKAEDLLAAAEIAAKLGDAKREARYRAEHAQHRRPAEAAQWFEKAEQPAAAAEQWAAAGKPQRAAELYAQAEEFDLAARLYRDLGDTEKEQEMESVRRSRDPQSIFAAREPAQSADGQATAVTAPARGRRPAVAEAPATSHGSPSSLPAPDERYVKRDELGRGAMGVVYRAFDTVLHRDVALKVLVGGIELGAQDARMLLDEARAVARLSHPNIVQVFDAGHDREGYFVVMELIDGVNLSDMLKASRPTISGAVRLGGQILAALGHAHARRLIHRDLKPSNILWTSDKQIKLTDFGLARVLAEKGDILTRPAGTPCYMAPEQIRGENVDARSDLYSFGCVLYEMLAGRPPFSGGGSLYHHLNSTPADPRQDRADIPEALARLVLDTLAKDPAKRPASAEQLLERLRQAA